MWCATMLHVKPWRKVMVRWSLWYPSIRVVQVCQAIVILFLLCARTECAFLRTVGGWRPWRLETDWGGRQVCEWGISWSSGVCKGRSKSIFHRKKWPQIIGACIDNRLALTEPPRMRSTNLRVESVKSVCHSACRPSGWKSTRKRWFESRHLRFPYLRRRANACLHAVPLYSSTKQLSTHAVGMCVCHAYTYLRDAWCCHRAAESSKKLRPFRTQFKTCSRYYDCCSSSQSHICTTFCPFFKRACLVHVSLWKNYLTCLDGRPYVAGSFQRSLNLRNWKSAT